MERTIKGVFLKLLVQAVKEKKGEEGLKKLEAKEGNLNFLAFRNYPMEKEVELKDEALKILYGKATEENEIEFGKLAFQMYTQSLVAKTMFSLIGNDFKRIVMSAKKLLETVTTGFEIQIEELEDKKVKIILGNNPHHIGHYQGVFLAAGEFFKVPVNVSSHILSPETYEYIISWK